MATPFAWRRQTVVAPIPITSADDRDASNAFREQVSRIVTQRSLEHVDTLELQRTIGQGLIRESRFLKDPNFQKASNSDLQLLAEMYDHHYFGGALLPWAKSYGLAFRWSSRMTRAGGKTTRTVTVNRRSGARETNYEIAISSTLLFQTFRDMSRPIKVTGIECRNRLEALQRVMEHEMIHLTEMLVWEDSCCAANRFQNIAYRLFRHTEHRHELITPRERAASEFNVRVGSRVCFQLEGKQYQGIVNRITRRATVLVKDPSGERYSDGQNYRKFYVPIALLRLAN